MPECYSCGEEVYVPSDREFTEGIDLCRECTYKRLDKLQDLAEGWVTELAGWKEAADACQAG